MLRKIFKHFHVITLVIIIVSIVGCKKKEGTMQCLRIVEHIKTISTGKKSEAIKTTYYSDMYSIIDDSTQPNKVLIDLKQNKVFFIHKKRPQYFVLSLNQFQKLAKDSPAHMTNDDVFISKTKEKRTIEGVTCQKYQKKVSRLGLDSEVWISNKIDAPMVLFYSFSQKSRIGNEMTKMIELMRRTGGYVMMSETSSRTLSHFYTKIQVSEITGMMVEPEFFRVPKGYTK